MENALTYKDFYHPEDPDMEEMFAFHGTSSEAEPSQEPEQEHP